MQVSSIQCFTVLEQLVFKLFDKYFIFLILVMSGGLTSSF